MLRYVRGAVAIIGIARVFLVAPSRAQMQTAAPIGTALSDSFSSGSNFDTVATLTDPTFSVNDAVSGWR